MSQAQLAKLMGVTTATVSRYESGHRELTVSVAQQLSSILRVPVASVIGIEHQENRRIAYLKHAKGDKVTAFDADMIGTLSENNDMLRIVQLEDNLMYPTASMGDLCVVRIGTPNPDESGIYALEGPSGRLTLRRIRVDDVTGQATLVADADPDGKSGPHRLEDVAIYGKVVWLGRRV